MNNELIDEVRTARAALAAEHEYDRMKIFEWVKAAHAARQQPLTSLMPNKMLETTGGAVTSPVARKRRVRPSGVSA
jgi:hypothetical protein